MCVSVTSYHYIIFTWKYFSYYSKVKKKKTSSFHLLTTIPLRFVRTHHNTVLLLARHSPEKKIGFDIMQGGHDHIFYRIWFVFLAFPILLWSEKSRNWLYKWGTLDQVTSRNFSKISFFNVLCQYHCFFLCVYVLINKSFNVTTSL